MINNIIELSKEIYMVPWTVLLILTAVVTLFSLISGISSDIDFDADTDSDTDTAPLPSGCNCASQRGPPLWWAALLSLA